MPLPIKNAGNQPSYDTSEPKGVNTTKKKTGNVGITNSIGVQPKDTGMSGGSARQIRTGKE